MAYKIMVDAGHGGEDPGAVHGNRKEKDDNLRLAMAVGRDLRNQGFDVVYTRTTDVYQTPFEKAQQANQSGADYFISLHRNSSPTPNQYSGVESLIYDKSGAKLEMAENINSNLADVGCNNLGVKERPGLVVLRRTQMPAVLVEAGFINNDEDNQLFDSKFEELAQAIADGVAGTLNDQTAMEASVYYRVQVGVYRVRQNADNMLYQLLEQGYPAFIIYENGLYKVQVGAFRQIGNAIIMERKLRHDGYNTLITT